MKSDSDGSGAVLDGILVVAVEQAVAAPFASRQLADLGARVIKIERPDGGDFARGYDATVLGQSSYFVWLNRGKESVVLDLRSTHGLSAVAALIARADVFIQNLAPGSAGRLGLDSANLRAAHPRLVTCDVSGYGVDGPYGGRRAYDLLIQAEVGVMSLTGGPGEPARAGISVADIAGGMYAYSGILTALLRRSATGLGSGVSVSLFDALAEWSSYAALFAGYSGVEPPRSGPRHPTIAPYGPVRTGDGGLVFLGVQNEREWVRFCSEVLERPELAADERFASNAVRVVNREQLDAVIEAVTATDTAAGFAARLDAAGIASGRLRDAGGLFSHPQLVERGRWRTTRSPAGPVKTLLPPAELTGVAARWGGVPGLGEHTEAVLSEFGL